MTADSSANPLHVALPVAAAVAIGALLAAARCRQLKGQRNKEQDVAAAIVLAVKELEELPASSGNGRTADRVRACEIIFLKGTKDDSMEVGVR